MIECVLFLLCLFVALPAHADEVVDGGTLIVGRLKHRLCGIDALEQNEKGYRPATTYLRDLTTGKTVKCVPVGHVTPCDGRSEPGSYDRIVAQCFVDGNNLAAEMVRAGHAVNWPKFSGEYYSRQNQQARHRRRGKNRDGLAWSSRYSEPTSSSVSVFNTFELNLSGATPGHHFHVLPVLSDVNRGERQENAFNSALYA